MTARLCLKARPTERQLADRLQSVEGRRADGLELYLDARDVADQATLDGVVRRLEACALPSDFALLIEGPVGSLDGQFFDATRESPADYLVLDRLAWMAREIGARAVNIHLIAPSDDLACLTLETRQALLERSVPLLRHFVEVTAAAGAVPTIEHMPLVLRMRQGGYYVTPIGMASADLRWAVEHVPGLKILADTSHATLYLNGRRAGADPSIVEAEARGHAWLEPLLAYVAMLPPDPPDLLGYVRALGPELVNAQVSNASGLLGEGLPYAEGCVDLDPTIRWMADKLGYVVTETLEPDQDDARYMRDALVRMRKAVA